MAAGDWAAGDIADDVARAAFMRRIAGGKMSGNGIGGYVVTGAFGSLADSSFVKGGLLCAIGGVSAGSMMMNAASAAGSFGGTSKLT